MLVECHPHADADTWLLENPGFVSGGNLRWWRDHFGSTERDAEAHGDGDAYDLLASAAVDVPPGADGLLFLPCMQGAMAPEWNGAARGAFFGLSLAHTRAHLTRAILEGSAYALRDILQAMTGAGLDVHRLTIVGGGAKSPLWRQIKADVTGLPVRVPTNVETTATGAAILAAVGSGQHSDLAGAVDAFVSYEPDEHEPDLGRHEAYLEAYGRYRELYFALKPLAESMAAG
jgi:xylulokinase